MKKLKVDFTKPIRHVNPNCQKVVYAGVQTLRDNKPITDRFKHLVMLGGGGNRRAQFVDDFGVGREGEKRIIRNVDVPAPKKPIGRVGRPTERDETMRDIPDIRALVISIETARRQLTRAMTAVANELRAASAATAGLQETLVAINDARMERATRPTPAEEPATH